MSRSEAHVALAFYVFAVVLLPALGVGAGMAWLTGVYEDAFWLGFLSVVDVLCIWALDPHVVEANATLASRAKE